MCTLCTLPKKLYLASHVHSLFDLNTAPLKKKQKIHKNARNQTNPPTRQTKNPQTTTNKAKQKPQQKHKNPDKQKASHTKPNKLQVTLNCSPDFWCQFMLSSVFCCVDLVVLCSYVLSFGDFHIKSIQMECWNEYYTSSKNIFQKQWWKKYHWSHFSFCF